LGLELEQVGIPVLGTPLSVIRITEDRKLFAEKLNEIDIPTPQSIACHTTEEVLKAAGTIGYPVMMRAGFSLGGLGSGKIKDPSELKQRADILFKSVPQILIEEYLEGWKELEYEILQDAYGNRLVICNMENLDPMGIHTGESIVVAPSQTLSNHEYHTLRSASLKIVEHLGIIGECNVQFALNPKNGAFRVIELNARLSRSSALASKATGYPLAYISTKLQLGKRLDELKNSVTRKTSAFFEPALDYLVVKIPRWDIQKFKGGDRRIGSEMKSVGEVMAIGRTFEEALQKAVRMLNLGATGLSDYPFPIPDIKEEITHATDRRLFALYRYFREGGSVEEARSLTAIDPWFLRPIAALARFEREFTLTRESLLQAKKLGFSDTFLEKLTGKTEIRQQRKEWGITPYIKSIDTLAGEFDAETNYLYTTYHGAAHDVEPLGSPLMILGSGPYAIGSSVEFDWCAVNLSKAFRERGKKTIILNSNPETVSTDFDESDRLYFEELTEERVKDLYDFEQPEGVVVSVGGQIANNLALKLAKSAIPLLGTRGEDIDRAEDRNKFSTLLESLGIDQPDWCEVKSLSQALEFGRKVAYPLLVRPSYVLSGAAMNIIYCEKDLEKFLQEAALISPSHPAVLSKFIENAKELELDGVAQDGIILIEAVSEHVENAGVHSGDATVVLPPQKLYLETIRQAKQIARKIISALHVTGPFNIQFIATENHLKVIECNLRASRSFPFVSKVTRHPFIEIAAKALLKQGKKENYETLDLDYVGVKTAQFSYSRLKGSNPVAHVEMASTGEVACLGSNLLEAFLNSWLATDQEIKGKRILLSVGGDKKGKLLPMIKPLFQKGWDLFATEGTHEFLAKNGIASTFLYKGSDHKSPSVMTAIQEKEVDLIINIPHTSAPDIDGFKIRRLAIDCKVPLVTNFQVALLLLQALDHVDLSRSTPKAWQEYIK
jgi:carbamoyl-phosphate synthase large subunit